MSRKQRKKIRVRKSENTDRGNPSSGPIGSYGSPACNEDGPLGNFMDGLSISDPPLFAYIPGVTDSPFFSSSRGGMG